MTSLPLQGVAAFTNRRSFYTVAPPPSKPLLRRRRNTPVRCSANRQALFNRISPVYDYLNDLLSLGQHRVWKRMAVSWSGAKKGDSVLDICCGSGDLTFLLSEKVGADGQVTGLDFSSELLSIAASRQQHKSNPCHKKIEWLEGNALDLPFPDASFDAITVGYGLRNVLDREKALQEMFRVLKPGCRASILDFNKSTQPITGFIQEWSLDNVVVPIATGYGLADDYKYLKSSIQGFLTASRDKPKKERELLRRKLSFPKLEIDVGIPYDPPCVQCPRLRPWSGNKTHQKKEGSQKLMKVFSDFPVPLGTSRPNSILQVGIGVAPSCMSPIRLYEV